jgi:antitoxin CcdA
MSGFTPGQENPAKAFEMGAGVNADIHRLQYISCMSEVLTVRVDKRTKEKLRKHKIDVAETVRTALQIEIQRKEEQDLLEALKEAGKILRKIPEDEIAKAVRKSRDER